MEMETERLPRSDSNDRMGSVDKHPPPSHSPEFSQSAAAAAAAALSGTVISSDLSSLAPIAAREEVKQEED